MALEEASVDWNKVNEVLEANKVTNKTDTESVNTGGGDEWQAFMGHIAHTEFDYLEEEMKKFKAPYVLSAEVEGYEHFHFLCRITKRQYHNFCKKVFKDKYRLHGRWWTDAKGRNRPRQYGKTEKIKDLGKMMAYTIKDKDFRTNMTCEEMETIMSKKIEDVENTKSKMMRMVKYVDTRLPELLAEMKNYRSEKYIRIAIIDYMLEEKQNIVRSTIERYYWYYVAYTDSIFKKNAYSIYDEIYNI